MPQPNILSVSQLNRAAKRSLEQALPNVWVQGELTNFAQPSSGHWYFTLKDGGAQVRCAMFRGRNMYVRDRLRAGDQVLVNASVSLYEGRGDYQLIIDSLQKAGLGDLHQRYEALKEKLGQEGLFAAELKRPLPPHPCTIGIISSPSGAAVHDMLTVLARRYPQAEVIIYPAVVQGSEAPASLRTALALANAQARCDLLIIGRGGGSLEDLWAFNNEHLVREVGASPTPIISAVGHEVDVTLCDFAADLRAPTPSAAAEAAVPDSSVLTAKLTTIGSRLQRAMASNLSQRRQRLSALRSMLGTPKGLLQHQQQRLDYQSMQLQQIIKDTLQEKRLNLGYSHHALQQNNPSWRVSNARQTFSALQQRLKQTITVQLQRKSQQLQHNAALLNAVSPLQTLQRGYSIVRTPQGKVLSSAHGIKTNQKLRLQFSDGEVEAQTINSGVDTDLNLKFSNPEDDQDQSSQ